MTSTGHSDSSNFLHDHQHGREDDIQTRPVFLAAIVSIGLALTVPACGSDSHAHAHSTGSDACSISCIPHDIAKGGSTTFYWSSNGTTCSLSCPGLNLQMRVPCNGQDSSHFQNLQQTQTCTITAIGDGGTVTCSDDVMVQ